MEKVPVQRSIAQAYEFLFRRIVTVLSLSWLAAVFFAVLRWAIFAAGPIPLPISGHVGIALLHLAGAVAALLLICTVAVPLTRAALGEPGQWVLAYFVVGARELWLFAALIGLYLIMIAVVAVCVLGVAAIAIGTKAALVHWPALAGSGVPVEALVRAVAVALAIVVTVYVGLRLSFFIYPVAAVETHASLKRSWELGGGNVLRISGVVLAILLPIYLLVFLGEYALMGPALLDAARTVFTAPGKIFPFEALFMAHALALSIGAAVVMVVLTALLAGASASAYLHVTGAAQIVGGVEILERIEPTATQTDFEPADLRQAPLQGQGDGAAEPVAAAPAAEEVAPSQGEATEDASATVAQAEPASEEQTAVEPAPEAPSSPAAEPEPPNVEGVETAGSETKTEVESAQSSEAVAKPVTATPQEEPAVQTGSGEEAGPAPAADEPAPAESASADAPKAEAPEAAAAEAALMPPAAEEGPSAAKPEADTLAKV